MIPFRTTTAAALLVLLAACSDSGNEPEAHDTESPSTPHSGHSGHPTDAPDPTALREGERMLDVAMPAAYTPSAPYGAGTDDYRCFLLDPKLTDDAFLTGIDIKPGNPDVVHHVILFKVTPEHLGEARAADRVDKGQGWTCFGGTGLAGEGISALDQAPWIGAWAPGGGEQVNEAGVGIPLAKGTRVVMQVHYNLLAGDAPDTSSAQLRLAPGDADIDALDTVLLPGPVELPCRPGKTGKLCDRSAAVADVIERFGGAGRIANYFPFLCGEAKPGPVQSCTRNARSAMTIRAVAGHMHLLGRQISITVNGKKVLDIAEWNFDDQGADAIDPVEVEAGDDITVTCRHDQMKRDIVPALKGQPERYVVWGEGTTDEMCLGILLVTRP